MRAIVCAAVLLVFVAPAFAHKCDELKTEIEEKIKKNGVSEFTVDVVAEADVKEATVVGSCDGGAKKITYKRGGDGAAAQSAGKSADKAAEKPAAKSAEKSVDKPAAKSTEKK